VYVYVYVYVYMSCYNTVVLLLTAEKILSFTLESSYASFGTSHITRV